HKLLIELFVAFAQELLTTNESIANADDSLDAVAALVELLPEPADMHVERARVAIVAVSPNTIQQLLSGHHAIRASRQHGQQREFLVRQFYLGAIANDSDVVEVDRQMIVFIRLAHRLVRTTHHGPHARE